MNAVEIKNLEKVYKTGVEAVKGISFSIPKGDFFALLGPNGAGKSTTISILASLVSKSSGSVKVFGHDLDTQQMAVKSTIGLVPQEFNFSIFEKVVDILLQQAGYYGISLKKARPKAEELLKRMGLWEKRDAAPNTLSGGMKRKLMVCRALVHDPQLLILDEPTAGVDVETRREMWDFITDLNKKGTTVLLTTHYLEEAEQLCKHIAIIHDGVIVEQGTMKSLLRKLKKETYVLDVDKIGKLEKLEGVTFEQLDDTTLSVELSDECNFADVISHLDKHGIHIISLRNKTNRLEEIFIDLTKK